MKKSLFLSIIVFAFIACNPKTDIGELISLRNKYQAEYDLLHATWNLRQHERMGYVDEHAIGFQTYEEFVREQICKDSIEILNIEIERYKGE